MKSCSTWRWSTYSTYTVNAVCWPCWVIALAVDNHSHSQLLEIVGSYRNRQKYLRARGIYRSKIPFHEVLHTLS